MRKILDSTFSVASDNRMTDSVLNFLDRDLLSRAFLMRHPTMHTKRLTPEISRASLHCAKNSISSLRIEISLDSMMLQKF